MTSKCLVGIIAAALTVCTSRTAPAQPLKLLINQIEPANLPVNNAGYELADWSGMTNSLKAAFAPANITVSHQPLSDLNALLSYDRLWITARIIEQSNAAFSALEQQNLSAFIATGRRVVLTGENNAFYTTWNNSILAPVGGSSVLDTAFSEDLTPTLVHPLTAGVTSIRTATDGIAIGGTSLFNKNLATLWRPERNVLSVLSINALGDSAGGERPGNRKFQSNIAAWLVPEPSSTVLVGVAAAATFRRRRHVGRQ